MFQVRYCNIADGPSLFFYILIFFILYLFIFHRLESSDDKKDANWYNNKD